MLCFKYNQIRKVSDFGDIKPQISTTCYCCDSDGVHVGEALHGTDTDSPKNHTFILDNSSHHSLAPMPNASGNAVSNLTEKCR